jgi:glyoxylase I family protein
MIQLERIDHVVLRTSRVADMTSFYCDVLGCTVERTVAEGVGLTQLRAGEALIDLVNIDSQPGQTGGAAPSQEGRNMDHLCLQIKAIDQDELIDWLSHQGIQAGPFETRYGAGGFGPSIYIQDPDGNTLELRPAQQAS